MTTSRAALSGARAMAALAVVSGAVACSAQPSAPTAPDDATAIELPTNRIADGDFTMASIVTGTLSVRAGCVVLLPIWGSLPSPTAVVWPGGFAAESDDAGRITLRDADDRVVAHEGDVVTAGGGSSSATITHPTACAGNDGTEHVWVQRDVTAAGSTRVETTPEVLAATFSSLRYDYDAVGDDELFDTSALVVAGTVTRISTVTKAGAVTATDRSALGVRIEQVGRATPGQGPELGDEIWVSIRVPPERLGTGVVPGLPVALFLQPTSADAGDPTGTVTDSPAAQLYRPTNPQGLIFAYADTGTYAPLEPKDRPAQRIDQVLTEAQHLQ